MQRNRWLTYNVIETVFDIVNMTHDNTICVVCKPTKVMYSFVRLNDKVRNICENSFTVSRVFVAMNVGCDDTGTCYVSHERRHGIHWALLVIDLKNDVTNYGDSFGWPLLSNLIDTVGSNLKQIDKDLRKNSMSSFENSVIINRSSCDVSNASDLGKWFYPLQTCSVVCSVIMVCMCAVLCDHWITFGTEEALHVPKPSINNRQLSIVVMSWIHSCHPLAQTVSDILGILGYLAHSYLSTGLLDIIICTSSCRRSFTNLYSS